MEKKTIAAHQIIDLVYLAGFTFFIFKILLTGDVTGYVHPRFIPFLWAAAALSVLIIVATMMTPSGDHHRKISWKRTAILVVPLLCGITVHPSSDAMANLSETPQKKQIAADADFNALPEPVVRARSSASILLDESHFFMILQDMYDNPTMYSGKKIVLTGMAYHKKKSPADEFAVMRLMMTCCTADLQPVGLVCVHTSSSALKDKSWVKIEGKLSSKNFAQGLLPFVEVETITPSDKPAQEYIYPI